MSKLNRVLQLVVCFGLLVAFNASAAPQKPETAGQYVDDSVLTTKVKTAIFNETSLKMFQINVKTYKAVVQLSGFVDSKQNVTKAGEVARGVEGVVSVENDLLVK